MMKFVLPSILTLSLLVLHNISDCTAQDEDESPNDTEGGVKCYVCTADDVECLSLISYKARYKLLQTCKSGCAVLLGQTGEIGEYDPSIKFARGCDDLDKCVENNAFCCKCGFDGCNINNYCNAGNYSQKKSIMWLNMVSVLSLKHLVLTYIPVKQL